MDASYSQGLHSGAQRSFVKRTNSESEISHADSTSRNQVREKVVIGFQDTVFDALGNANNEQNLLTHLSQDSINQAEKAQLQYQPSVENTADDAASRSYGESESDSIPALPFETIPISRQESESHGGLRAAF